MTTPRYRYGALVRVSPPARPAFVGTVYSEFDDANGHHYICVTRPDGCGVAYLERCVRSAAVHRARAIGSKGK